MRLRPSSMPEGGVMDVSVSEEVGGGRGMVDVVGMEGAMAINSRRRYKPWSGALW